MDVQLIAIIGILLLIFVLDRFGRDEEGYVDRRPGYTNPSVLIAPRDERYMDLPYSVNMGRQRDFGNFGTFGSYPPNPLCNSCNMVGGVSDPYIGANSLGDVPGQNLGQVATQCSDIGGRNYDDLGRPFLVSARSAGRGRVCRRLV